MGSGLFTSPDSIKSPFYSDREKLKVEVSSGLDDREVEAVIRSMLGACISAEEVKRVVKSMGFPVSEKRIYRALRNLERAGEVVYRKRRWCRSPGSGFVPPPGSSRSPRAPSPLPRHRAP